MPDRDPKSLTLALEMSNPSAIADPLAAGAVALGAVGDGGCEPIGEEPITLRSPRDDALAPAIDRLLRRCGVRPGQLDRVAVSAGPGGFTSVRIAVTTAKTIAEVVGARVVVVPSDEVAARTAVQSSVTSGPIAVLLAGKRDTAWRAVFEPAAWDQPAWPAPLIRAVHSAETFAEAARPVGVTAMVADAHAPAGFTAWAQEQGIPIAPLALSAGALLAASAGHEPVDPVVAAPIYPREPEAVTKWRERA